MPLTQRCSGSHPAPCYRCFLAQSPQVPTPVIPREIESSEVRILGLDSECPHMSKGKPVVGTYSQRLQPFSKPLLDLSSPQARVPFPVGAFECSPFANGKTGVQQRLPHCHECHRTHRLRFVPSYPRSVPCTVISWLMSAAHECLSASTSM